MCIRDSHSRVNGYVKNWYFDIGARVKSGDVLAEIDTPEIDQQMAQLHGELAKTQANLRLAEVTSSRWKALRTSQAVSQQAADEKSGDLDARRAEVIAAQANLDRVKAMATFNRIVAPFDGVVTARRVDVGALVSSTDSSRPALFDVAAIDKMRIYVRVPQVFTAGLKPGIAVSLKLPQYPNRIFAAKLDTTSNAISRESRALLVELTADNSDGLLTTGAYAEVTFDLPLDGDKLVVPGNAVILRNRDPQVALVDADGKVTLKKIEILLDTGISVEIANGLSDTDRIVISPPDSLSQGETVRTASVNGKPIEQAEAPRIGPGGHLAQ